MPDETTSKILDSAPPSAPVQSPQIAETVTGVRELQPEEEPKKTARKRSTAKKTATKKTTARKTAAKKTTAKRSTAKKSVAKESSEKTTDVSTLAEEVLAGSWNTGRDRDELLKRAGHDPEEVRREVSRLRGERLKNA